MSGSRSRIGCYTCRIRKKKCDEQHPCCRNCQIRKLPCYSYDAPPDWMHGKRSWKEITESGEAQWIRSIAEAQYKARRRNSPNSSDKEADGAPNSKQAIKLATRGTWSSAQESLWWDGGFCTSLPVCRASHEDARLLMIFLDVIHPIQFGFYQVCTAMDRNWLINSLCSNKARFHAALTVSACFDTGLREPHKVDGIGLSLEVRERQAVALRGLQTSIRQFEAQGCPTKDLVRKGMQILEVVHQLLSLEIFSMMEGAWEIHHRAARTLLSAIHAYRAPESCDREEAHSHSSPLETALKEFSSPDIQRTLEFHVTCFVWVDIIANATFGSPARTPRHFDYIPLLRVNGLKTQDVMGCDAGVMATIAEITRLADWKAFQLQSKSLNTRELAGRAKYLHAGLVHQMRELEQRSTLGITKREEDSRLVTLQFAYAAQLYLHVVVSGTNTAAPELVLCVSRSLQLLEALPSRLVIRVCWPFTIVGCMAGKSLHNRFRAFIARTVEQKQLLGMTWKGLIAMEECWRLRHAQSDLEGDCEWKRAMESLGMRILLV
ncbi:fungal-specific transcription factor domain-containing protein [Lipomyces kononenkoae]